jgi:hypothetical protein
VHIVTGYFCLKSLESNENFSIFIRSTNFMSRCNGFIRVLTSFSTTADGISSSNDDFDFIQLVPIFANCSGAG